MYGAFIGDIVGSTYEFNNIRTKNFDIFRNDATFTDDTVMTVAVADALVHPEEDVAKILQKWGRKYRSAGYGGRFRHWLDSENPKPYRSYGNGAAMRIMVVGHLAKSEEEVKQLAKKVTEVTHNHPEGLKAAEVVAMCIFKARHGASKEELRKLVYNNAKTKTLLIDGLEKILQGITSIDEVVRVISIEDDFGKDDEEIKKAFIGSDLDKVIPKQETTTPNLNIPIMEIDTL